MRVAKDGSTQFFRMPQGEPLGFFAPAPPGLIVLKPSYSKSEGVTYSVLHFDSAGQVAKQGRVRLDFQPERVGVTGLGRTVVVGNRTVSATGQLTGIVLDSNDSVIAQIRFPTENQPKDWTFATNRVSTSEHALNIALKSSASGMYALARVEDTGDVQIVRLQEPAAAAQGKVVEWLFGPDVAAAYYQVKGDKPAGTTRFDLYDLSSGEFTGTRMMRPAGFTLGCLLGTTISMVAHKGCGPDDRALAADALKLVTVPLLEPAEFAASASLVLPGACN